VLYIYIYIYIYDISNLRVNLDWLTVHRSITLVDLQLDALRPFEDEQGNAQNMKRILINVLYVNK